MEQNRLRAIVSPLLSWYDTNARQLPWRENRDPYRVWVSEIMLQQTQVETVKPYFCRFIEQLPTIRDLAEAPEEQLMKLWEGLGYYSRARNLQKAARIIMGDYRGVFPREYQDILALPGIGSYTAGAVSSICFEKPVAAVDGNVLRVFARLTGDDTDISSPQAKARASQALSEVYPAGRCGDFTQSLMELGALICLPGKKPDCGRCPISAFCCAFRTGRQGELPVKAKRKPRKQEKHTVLVLWTSGRVAVYKRAEGTLLGGLWAFPMEQGHLSQRQAAALLDRWGIKPISIEDGLHKKHIFTHVEWDMKSYYIRCREPGADFTWMTIRELERQATLPSAYQAFAGHIGQAFPDARTAAADI